MIAQTEKPMLSLEELEANIGQRPTYASGGQIEGFGNGWALNIVSGDKAHYYYRTLPGQAVSICGVHIESRLLYGAGNYQHCRNCQRSADKRGLS